MRRGSEGGRRHRASKRRSSGPAGMSAPYWSTSCCISRQVGATPELSEAPAPRSSTNFLPPRVALDLTRFARLWIWGLTAGDHGLVGGTDGIGAITALGLLRGSRLLSDLE